MSLTTTEDQTPYEQAVAQCRREIDNRPDEMLSKTIAAVTAMRDNHRSRRVEIEAQHQVKLEQIRLKFNEEKDFLVASIRDLENQLSEARVRWGQTCDNEQVELAAERERWQRIDAAQRRLIEAEQLMLDKLTE